MYTKIELVRANPVNYVNDSMTRSNVIQMFRTGVKAKRTPLLTDSLQYYISGTLPELMNGGEVLLVDTPQLTQRLELPGDIFRRLWSDVPDSGDDRSNLFVLGI